MKRKVITQEELDQILRKHKLWLKNEEGGEHADLAEADLTGANLAEADLTGANLTGANLSWATLAGADLAEADLTGANLSWATLAGADLAEADLTGANLAEADLTMADLTRANLKMADLDFSSLPLWCGSLKANFDDRQLVQIAYHLVKAGLNSNNASEETKAELEKLIDFANQFHRVDECGKIEKREKNDECNVNHPSHYQGANECIDVMRAMFGDEAVKGFCKCNAYKYRFRADKKNGEEDIKKAEFYETYLINMTKGEKQ